jgi:glycosyltransferase involved in cell wall biosynthesis
VQFRHFGWWFGSCHPTGSFRLSGTGWSAPAAVPRPGRPSGSGGLANGSVFQEINEVRMLERPARVLIACDHIDHDGALHGGGRQLIELARALDRDHVEPTVCVFRPASQLGRELQIEGLPFLFFGDHRFNPISLWKLIRLIRQHRIDVLHLTDFRASTFGRIAGILTGTPTVVQVITHHSEFQPRGFPAYVELAFKVLAPLTDKALAISSSVKDFAVKRMGFAADEVEVLHYPLPQYSFSQPTDDQMAALRNSYGIEEDAPVIGAVTRFHAVKGIRYLLDAFPEVLRSFPDARLLLVGQGPEEAQLRDQARQLGIEDAVIFAGFQREAQVYVGAFTASVVPSLEEGFGLVALESLALGVPVVASRVGGLPGIVTDGQTGALVAPGSPEEIAAALIGILRAPELRRRMSDAARQEAQKFSLDKYVNRLTEIYHGLANGRTA